jgi:hypothetical protein
MVLRRLMKTRVTITELGRQITADSDADHDNISVLLIVHHLHRFSLLHVRARVSGRVLTVERASHSYAGCKW